MDRYTQAITKVCNVGTDLQRYIFTLFRTEIVAVCEEDPSYNRWTTSTVQKKYQSL